MTEINVGDARVVLGDCRDVLKTLPDSSVDSIVTDPPYELGFMGKKWDSTGIAYDVSVWVECLRVLKPGGHILAFGGSRTFHRMAVAIEDAGFEIRDSFIVRRLVSVTATKGSTTWKLCRGSAPIRAGRIRGAGRCHKIATSTRL